jgi:hypothetical protein
MTNETPYPLRDNAYRDLHLPAPESLKDYANACVALGLTPSEDQAGQLTRAIVELSRRLADAVEPLHPHPGESLDGGNLWVQVVVETAGGGLVADYVMNHADRQQRRVLGEQCRNAFMADQAVFTFPQFGRRG